MNSPPLALRVCQPINPPGDSEPERPLIRGPLSLDRVFKIMLLIASNPHGKSLSRLSEELATPKTSLLNLLPALVREGYLLRDKHQYRLGPQAFHLASSILQSHQDIASIARPLLQRLAFDSDKTVTLCVLTPDERAILHIVKAESPGAMRVVVHEGERAPLHTTAGGRVILAFQTEEWMDAIFRGIRLPKHTQYTITDPVALRQSLAEVRRRGFAVTRGETYETIGAVAAPAFGPDGFVVAVVAAGSTDMITAQEEDLGAMVRAAALELSALLRN